MRPSEIWSIADSLERFRILADGTQAPDRLLLQLVVVPVLPVRPVMRPQVMPQVLHRVQLRRVRQQPDQAHVARHHQVPAGVVARPVPDQHRVDPGGQLPRELLQEQVDHRRVQLGHDQRRGRPGGGADRRQHVQRLRPRLPHRPRPRPLAGPDPGERPLLAEPGLVLSFRRSRLIFPSRPRLGARLWVAWSGWAGEKQSRSRESRAPTVALGENFHDFGRRGPIPITILKDGACG